MLNKSTRRYGTSRLFHTLPGDAFRITLLPELLESPFSHSILKRAREKGLLEIKVHYLRQWAVNEYEQVDDYQYGGGAGMVIMPEPLANAIESLSRDIPLRCRQLHDARLRAIESAD